MNDVIDYLRAFLAGVVVLVVIAVVLGTVTKMGLAPQPGEAFYVAWLDLNRYGSDSLFLVVPGVVGALAIIANLLSDERW
jgi:hypothetical protein